MHLQHDSDVGLIQFDLALQDQSVQLPALLQLPSHSKPVDEGGVDWQVGLDASFGHLLQDLVGHFWFSLASIDLHQGSVEILAFPEL